MLEKKQINKNTKFLILGNTKSKDGQILISEIKKKNVANYFILFDYFIPNSDYYNYVFSSDYILPLLHQDINYLNFKISGTFNLAYSFKKPILYQAYFKNITIYKDEKWSFKYKCKKFMNFLN